MHACMVGIRADTLSAEQVNKCLSIKGAEDTVNKPFAFEVSTNNESMFFIAESEKVIVCGDAMCILAPFRLEERPKRLLPHAVFLLALHFRRRRTGSTPSGGQSSSTRAGRVLRCDGLWKARGQLLAMLSR
jgi:hypothetical protein